MQLSVYINTVHRYTLLLVDFFVLDFDKSVNMDVKNESKVLVIYTGGTSGMVRNNQGVLAPQVFFIY